MHRSPVAKHIGLLLFLSITAFYLYGLARLPLVGSDEPRYAEVAREMFVRGDPITPTLGGKAWFEKPALLYWMMMASFGLFGVSEFSARLGPALSGAATVLIICCLVYVLNGKRAVGQGPRHLWVAASLASTIGIIVFARAATFDIVLTMTVTASLACFFLADVERRNTRQRLLLVGFYIFVGASLLAKGLLGIVIPYMVIACYYLFQRGWPGKAIVRSTLWGVPLALLVASSWYGPVIGRNGWKFIDIFFIQQHFARYLSNKYHHPQPFYFYLPIMAMLSIPWLGFLVAGLWDARHWNWRPATTMEKLRLFAMAWLVAPLIFFSISKSKLPGYVLPSLPAAMLIAGDAINKYIEFKRNKAAMRFTSLLFLILACGACIYNFKSGAVSGVWLGVFIAPLLVSAIIGLGWTERRGLCIASTILAMFLATGTGIYSAAGNAGDRRSVRALLKLASARGYGSLPLLQLYDIERTAEFYAAERLEYRQDGEPVKLDGVDQVENAARIQKGAVLVLVPVKDLWQLTEDKNLETRIIGDNATFALAAETLRN